MCALRMILIKRLRYSGAAATRSPCAAGETCSHEDQRGSDPDDACRQPAAPARPAGADRGARESASGSTRRPSSLRLAGAVRDVVKQQVEIGIDSVCDGEQSKISYTFYTCATASRALARLAVADRHRRAAADRGASRHPRPPRFHGAAARGARRHVVVRRRRGAVLHRSGDLPEPRPARDRYQEPRRRGRGRAPGRGVYERRPRPASSPRKFVPGPLLPERGRLRRSARRRV